MNAEYYKRFKFFTENKYWEKYLQWAYPTCLNDLSRLHFKPDLAVEGFTALLCGTSGETTALNFAKFVLSHNKRAKIIILDISESQITQSRTALKNVYPNADIKCIIADALHTGLESESINYIETDAFFEFFNSDELTLLLIEWKRILKMDGFATTRAFASDTFLEKRLDFIRVLVAHRYLKIGIYVHHLDGILNAISNSGLKFVQGGHAYCPTFKRFSLLKRD